MELSFITISSPGTADAAILSFIAANDDDFYPPIATRRDLTEFVQSVYASKGSYIVCYCDSRIVGLAAVYMEQPSFICYYLYAAIDKDFRHQGIASALFEHIHQICREKGVQRAMVKTWSTNLMSQAMFRKHGFFHIDTVEDDRSKGVHTFFFAKSFTDGSINGRVTCLGVVADDGYGAVRFAETIGSIPKTRAVNEPAMPFVIVRDARLHDGDQANERERVIAMLEERNVSHVIVMGQNGLFSLDFAGTDCSMEVVNVPGIVGSLVNKRTEKCLLVSANIAAANEYYKVARLHNPDRDEQVRIAAIIDENVAGRVSPAYYRNELISIARSNGCGCVLLADNGLHKMFGFDKRYDGIEIFDPLMEVSIMIQSNWQGHHHDPVPADARLAGSSK